MEYFFRKIKNGGGVGCNFKRKRKKGDKAILSSNLKFLWEQIMSHRVENEFADSLSFLLTPSSESLSKWLDERKTLSFLLGLLW